MAGDPRDAELERFLCERGGHLLRAAVLLTGSREAGEDLVQAALERLLPRRHAIGGDPEGYLRRTIYNLAADGWRRKGRWRARVALLGSGVLSSAPDGSVQVEQRDELVRLLLRLPPGQRAAIVLRYWEDLTDAEAAEVLGCSASTVRSAVSRGLRRLRELSGAVSDPVADPVADPVGDPVADSVGGPVADSVGDRGGRAR
jgi:RNA polymerase sigma-70 factor (sigma-E family)